MARIITDELHQAVSALLARGRFDLPLGEVLPILNAWNAAPLQKATDQASSIGTMNDE